MANKRTIVVIEDEDAIRRGIVDMLTIAGYQTIESGDGESGLTEARRAGVSLVLLDLLLPKMNGFEVLEELRRTRQSLPVIILTARGSEDDRIRGLRSGADDYVMKPFSARELLARVEAVLRRSPERQEPILSIRSGSIVVDCGRREICGKDNERIALSEMETDILQRLASMAGRSVSREELLSTVWSIRDGAVETRAIDMHITRLRQKLRSHSADDTEWIVTVRGKGYMLGPKLEVMKEGDGATSE